MGKKRNLGKPLAESDHTGFDYSQSQKKFDKGQKKKYGDVKSTDQKFNDFNKGMFKTSAGIMAAGLAQAAIKKING